MTDRAGRVEALWEKGFAVGPAPDNPCTQCEHRWGSHLLHIDFDTHEGAKELAGRWSCPEDGCTCTGTWNVGWPGKTEHICDFGRKLISHKAAEGYQCEDIGNNIVHLTDTGQHLHLCDAHNALIQGALH